ncbi:hypothetical protein PNOK_0447700 [Pyrrhoderma noxium]|uniref:Uncharacterized protein n=1 Tax=Pyrrhoderma noxium TaxID=2282107 RepID=A0A286UIU3_9AGAM|nr:hypothetical protein PNOK_0447700 [Pyrrhoderma noxium]
MRIVEWKIKDKYTNIISKRGTTKHFPGPHLFSKLKIDGTDMIFGNLGSISVNCHYIMESTACLSEEKVSKQGIFRFMLENLVYSFYLKGETSISSCGSSSMFSRRQPSGSLP